ncbi:FAD:protein FMN transferase [Marivita sp. S0852]|uniref:FAD:protein FMN transferase n=1 Tax=Marivita sp. S0852 TaxID=3373893 RepID=UPI003981CB3D
MTQSVWTRRRVLQIAAALPFAGVSAHAWAEAPVAQWRGTALGADSQIVLSGLDQDEAAPVFALVRDEIARLESIFSLYDRMSELSRLNSDKTLARPSPELIEVLDLSHTVWSASFGAFDPTVQPLWQARAMDLEQPADKYTFADVLFSSDLVTLRPNMALTLNGVAQGYITDQIADMLRGQGLVDVVVDAGEQRVLGTRPDGTAWRAGVADSAGQVVKMISLRDHALATSSGAGTLLGQGAGHILDARTGVSADLWSTLSITHDHAAVADAVSTAACCLTETETDHLLKAFDGAKIAYRAKS